MDQKDHRVCLDLVFHLKSEGWVDWGLGVSKGDFNTFFFVSVGKWWWSFPLEHCSLLNIFQIVKLDKMMKNLGYSSGDSHLTWIFFFCWFHL